jgi:transposase
LPPYSPALSPVEPCWSKLKTALRKAKARTRAALDAAIAGAMTMVSHTDAWGWFKHCGYPLQ